MNLFSKLITKTRAGVLAGVMLSIMPVVAEASIFTFFDLTDSVTIATDPTAAFRVQGSCAGEVCMLRILRPVDPLGGTLSQFSWSDQNIFDPSGSLSDTILTTANTVFQDGFVDLVFRSDVDGGPPLSPLPFGNPITETGFVQIGPTYSWNFSSGTILFDNIRFQSDIVEAPEPAMLSLFGLALAGLGFSRRKKA